MEKIFRSKIKFGSYDSHSLDDSDDYHVPRAAEPDYHDESRRSSRTLHLASRLSMHSDNGSEDDRSFVSRSGRGDVWRSEEPLEGEFTLGQILFGRAKSPLDIHHYREYLLMHEIGPLEEYGADLEQAGGSTIEYVARGIRRYQRAPWSKSRSSKSNRACSYVDFLDFWVDVTHHENMCRAYFSGVKRSQLATDAGASDLDRIRGEWPEYADWASASLHQTRAKKSKETRAASQHRRLAAPMVPMPTARQRQAHTRLPTDDNLHFLHRPPQSGHHDKDSTSELDFELDSALTKLEKLSISAHGPQVWPDREAGPRSSMAHYGIYGSLNKRGTNSPWEEPELFHHQTEEFEDGQPVPAYTVDGRPISRSMLLHSAESLWWRYFAPGAPKYLPFPHAFRKELNKCFWLQPAQPGGTKAGLVVQEHTIPEAFTASKLWAFAILEESTFRRFMKDASYHNVTRTGAFARELFGLLCLLAALTTAFAMIFLDVAPRAKRVGILAPFLLGWSMYLGAWHGLDPILALVGLRQCGTITLEYVAEPEIRSELRQQGAKVVFLASVLTALLVILFSVVPGHAL